MILSILTLLPLAFLPTASSKTYFTETFNSPTSLSSWTIPSTWKDPADLGKWEQTLGKWHAGIKGDLTVKTGQDAKFYGMSKPLDEAFDNTNKDLIIQYTVKHEQRLDCGGAYIKLMPSPFDAEAFGGDTKYGIMFGPDICGSSNRKTHVILTNGDENLLIKKEVRCETDQLSHMYTLVLRHADDTFEVLIDGKSIRSGKIADEFDILPPLQIPDESFSKPDDWIDEATIPDPDEVKPEGYDDVSPEIPSPTAVKPEDWDDEDDGEWETPFVPNPAYKGTYKPKMIDNPDYVGLWVQPMIDNDAYEVAKAGIVGGLHARCGSGGCTHVGFELWQVTAGTSFDDIIITDSVEEAQEFAEKHFFKKVEGEKAMFKDKEEKIREEKMAKEEEERIMMEGSEEEEEEYGGGEEMFDEL